MSLTLSPQIRLVALVGLLAAAGLAVWTFALAHRTTGSAAPAVAVAPPAPAPAKPQPKPAPAPVVDPTLPAPLRHALAYSKVVVAALYLPGSARDAQALQAARQGAKDAHVGFAALNVGSDAVAGKIAGRLREIADPSVLVVTRPGTVATQLTGYPDRETVAQAAVNAPK